MNLLHLYMILHCKYSDLHMDDFEKDFPEFNWRNVPAYKHPQGKDCPCPKHEYIREQINIAKAISNNNKDISPDHRQKAQISLKLCPDHYKVYFKEVVPSMPLKYRIMTKIALKIGAVVIQQIPYMQSDQCFYCKFGSGGFDKKTPIIR
jgi:hypothetical protein